MFDHYFTLKLNSWIPLRRSLYNFFSAHEVEKLSRILSNFDLTRRTIALLSFENHYATLGGLGTVMRHLPLALKNAGEKPVLLSPLYQKIPAVSQALKAKKIQRVSDDLPVVIGQHVAQLSCWKDITLEYPAFYIGVAGYFSAAHHPYDYSDPTQIAADALAFGCAVPSALSMLGYKEHVVVHAHDWETALAPLYIKHAILADKIGPMLCLLTLHNSFDAQLPSPDHLGVPVPAFANTVLKVAIPIIDGPLTTVSTPFAAELLNDPLQKSFFVPHCTGLFSQNPPIGIENGLFGIGASPFGVPAIAKAKKGDLSDLLAKKDLLRTRLQAALGSLLGDSATKLFLRSSSKKSSPLMFMSGRFDLMQKGFDIVFHALSQMPRGSVRLFFCPTISDASEKKRLEFFYALARQQPGIIIWPKRLPHDIYHTLLQGADFLLMPSLYEPFGAATEGYAAGTPVIARATGGLWAQVCSRVDVPVPSYIKRLPGLVASSKSAGCGLLFRENYDGPDIEDQWRIILSKPPKQRTTSKLYASMVDACAQTLNEAIELHLSPKEYGTTILNGILRLAEFDWQVSVDKYRRVFIRTAQAWKGAIAPFENSVENVS